MKKHRLVYSIYIAVDAETEDEAFKKGDLTCEALFERAIGELDKQEGIQFEDAFCDWTQD